MQSAPRVGGDVPPLHRVRAERIQVGPEEAVGDAAKNLWREGSPAPQPNPRAGSRRERLLGREPRASPTDGQFDCALTHPIC
jgi:hypothetical protein